MVEKKLSIDQRIKEIEIFLDEQENKVKKKGALKKQGKNNRNSIKDLKKEKK